MTASALSWLYIERAKAAGQRLLQSNTQLFCEAHGQQSQEHMTPCCGPLPLLFLEAFHVLHHDHTVTERRHNSLKKARSAL